MALIFHSGDPSVAFLEEYANAVHEWLTTRFGPTINLSPANAWESTETAWSGWRLLQEAAAEDLGAANAPHLLSMEAWNGVYLPAELEPFDVLIDPNGKTPLAVASLPHLQGELEAWGRARDLPTDPEGLRALAEEYEDDEDEDFEIQTYAQLLLGAHHAMEHNQPLWVVK